MSRRRSAEPDFGSDSFLDVVANIVGILIILIVIAGLRAARAPVPVTKVEGGKRDDCGLRIADCGLNPDDRASPESAIRNPKSAISDSQLSTLNSQPIELPSPPRPALLPPVPTAAPQLRDDLLADIQRLRERIAALNVARGRLEEQLHRARSTHQTLTASLGKLSAEMRERSSARQRLQTGIAALKAESDRGRAKLAELRRQYDEAKRKPKNVQTVQHKLTPVGQQVTGKEVHFRVAEGKVALVPIEDLVLRMRDEVLRRKSWLLKFPTHRGTVGPVGGFEMQYSVQRQLSSTLDELRGGYGQIKVVLQGWKIEPTVELRAETVEQALRPDSRFLQEIHVADSSATVTFWVYPDSYAAFRKLQAAVHRDGLRVAARPLPFGVPIAGSPRGSRSSGQ